MVSSYTALFYFGNTVSDPRLLLNIRTSIPTCCSSSQRGTAVFLNLDLISGMKYVHLLTENSLGKVGVLRKIFRFLQIHITE